MELMCQKYSVVPQTERKGSLRAARIFLSYIVSFYAGV